MSQPLRIAIAMSGGVDSSVSAALLKEAGHDIFGVMLRLWSPSQDIRNRCCSPDDLSLAQQVSATLEIPFYTLDAKDIFKATVVDPFIHGYAKGITPNPCLICNRDIRWGFLLERVLAMGATHMATGHYARVVRQANQYQLLRAVDGSKDQSYILSVLNQQQLSHARFPLGNYHKDQVRELASTFNLPVADRGESQDLCFLGDLDYREFLEMQQVPLPPPGPILDTQGNLLGEHTGLATFTIGQRKGIGLTAPEPYYVLQKDMSTNRLIVVQQRDLGRDEFFVDQLNWISGEAPQTAIQAQTRIRYKSREVQSTLVPEDQTRVRVKLEESLPDVTPGQAAVFYKGELCLGGGIICP
jgi:tRNA-specific 2-thiouridylase